MKISKPFLLLHLLLFPCYLFSQISGKVTDSINKNPLQYVSVWIKNKALGATTDRNGNFTIDQANPGDTLVATFLGYEYKVLTASEGMKIVLSEKIEQLKEVVIIPMKFQEEKEVSSYKRPRQIRDQLYSGENLQYSAARYFEYRPEYEQTPFLKTVSFVTRNALNFEVPILISIITADSTGRPTDQYLIKNKLANVGEGRTETKIDLKEEMIQVPENGFFVVLKRIYQKEYRLHNRNYVQGKSIKFIYQPSMGLVNEKQAEKLWWHYGGSWKSPSELQRIFPFEKRDLAINVQLTN